MLKKNIKSFIVSGVIKDDAAFRRIRELQEKLLLEDMRARGYVPVLDLEAQFSIKYNEAKENYSFYLEMFGVYVGKKKSLEIEGFSGQQFYKRQTSNIDLWYYIYMMTTETYNQRQIKEILGAIGVHIASETSTDFLCLCPFHANRHTPSFAVSYSKGLYVCYNPSCDARGTLLELIRKVGDMNEFQAMRLVGTLKKEADNHFSEDLEALFENKATFVEFEQAQVDSLHNNLMQFMTDGKEYFLSRQINEESMEYFQLGYSYSQQMVTVPVHSPTGLLVGIVGRSIEGKRFKNSTNLPRSLTMFNIHRARKESATIIVCESSFDAIRIHQAGFPNVVATLGGSLSKENINNLNKYSSSIIIATDADEAGRKLGKEIAFKLKNKDIMWASYSEGIVYPHDAKDVGDLTETEIYQCMKNATSNFEYLNW